MKYDPWDKAFDMPTERRHQSHEEKRLLQLDFDIKDIKRTMTGDTTTQRSQSMLLNLRNLQLDRKYLIASLYRNQLGKDIEWSMDGTHVKNFKDGIPDL
jgi:hypothetical protein